MGARRSLVAVVAVCAVVFTACTSGDDASTTTTQPSVATTTAIAAPVSSTSTQPTVAPASSTLAPSTTTTTVVPIDDGSLVGVPIVDPAACAFDDAPTPGNYQITFVTGGFLVGADGDGTLTCLTPFENQDRLVWGPSGDVLLAGTTRLRNNEDTATIDAFTDIIGPGASFTRPTGRNLIWVQDGELWKAETLAGDNLREISFLPEHVAVTYHPAGVEIATAGVDDDGLYGVWISKNDGSDPQRVVTAADAVITEVAFSESSGFFLSFVAEHADGTRHLHELTLIDADGLAVRNEFDASIALESTRSLHGIVANPWTDDIAITEGTCDDEGGPHVRLAWGGELPARLADIATEAIAWLPDFELLVAAYPDGCDGPRELWIVGSGAGVPSFDNPILVVRNAGPAAVRAPYPDPPVPLGEIDLDNFA